jgi:hypothetical protein
MTAHRPAGAVLRSRWSRRQVRALGAHIDFATYASIFNTSETSAREQHRAGTLPPGVVPIRVGRKWIIPTQPILELLGLSGGQGNRQPGRDQAPGERGEQPGEAASGPDGETAGLAGARRRQSAESSGPHKAARESGRPARRPE